VVQDVYMEAGDQVKVGDVLMKLNTNGVPSSILSAQADLSTAKKSSMICSFRPTRSWRRLQLT
jgi:multidrug resistance efflux pump